MKKRSFACAFVLVPTATAAVAVAALAADDGDRYKHLATLARAFHYIEGGYVRQIDPSALIHGAIRGMISALDRHSAFLDPAELAAAREQAEAREGPTVESSRLDGAIAYLRIVRFDEHTHQEVKSALEGLGRPHPIKALVLDLRDNQGGILDEAARIADLWIAEGTIVSTVGRRGKPEVERAHPSGDEPSYPIAVLVNGKTASSAEVLAAALQDHGRAKIAGTHTYGKGTVQTIIELEDRSALRLTVANYLTPKGRSLEGEGIRPDVVVPPGEGVDRQLQSAVQLLGQRGVFTEDN